MLHTSIHTDVHMFIHTYNVILHWIQADSVLWKIFLVFPKKICIKIDFFLIMKKQICFYLFCLNESENIQIVAVLSTFCFEIFDRIGVY